MFGRRVPKTSVRQAPQAGKNCCVRTIPSAQPAPRPVQPVQRPNPVKR